MPPSPSAPNPARQPLLARLDALADLAHRRHGLLLAPDGQLTGTDAAAVAHAIGIEPGHGGASNLLLLPGIAVGILRTDGLRIRAAPLHDAWRQLDDTLRAGLLFAAWCQHATFLPLLERFTGESPPAWRIALRLQASFSGNGFTAVAANSFGCAMGGAGH